MSLPSASSPKQVISDWGPSEPLRHHLVALCLLLALSASPEAIFELLPGITPGQLEMLRVNKVITKKQAELKAKFLGEDAAERFQNYMPKAFEIMAEVLNAPTGEMKLAQRFEAAKWLFEKVTGRAKQELEVSGGVTILQLIKKLDERRDAIPLPGQHGYREVGPLAPKLEAVDKIAEWVRQQPTPEGIR